MESKKIEHSVIYGRHAVLLACKTRRLQDISRILVSEKSAVTLFPKNLQAVVEVVSQNFLNKIVAGNNGFACYIKPLEEIAEHELLSMKNIIALDCVQDVGNIGAILRSAAAFGVEAIVYTKDKMPNISRNATVAKHSSGGMELVKLCEVTNLHRSLQNLQKNSFWVVGTDANGEAVQNISRQYRNSKKVVVFGNEESGIKPQIRKSCDVFASIEINPLIGSLNVSAAAAIIMWEMFAK